MDCIADAVPGFFFHNKDWFGGYTSWPQRMIRLAHVAFFGKGLLNLGFALTARTLSMESGLLFSEPTPEQCHRSLVAERLAVRWPNVEVIHILKSL